MKPLLVLAIAVAQGADPAVQSCRELGERELKRAGFEVKALEIDRDRNLLLERKAEKLGNQPIGATLSGHGAIVPPTGAPTELSFVCLLASQKRALWFQWLPRRDAPALHQCRRTTDAQDCLQRLFETAERDLVEVSSYRYQDALDADAKAGNDSASSAFRDAAAAWRNYRDLECARRDEAGSDAWRACLVDLTRRRYYDLQ